MKQIFFRINIALAVWLLPICLAWTADSNKTVTISPSHQYDMDSSFLLEPSESAAFEVNIVSDGRYAFKSSSISTSNNKDYFIWTTSGGSTKYTCSIMNTAWLPATAGVRVDCLWRPIGGGGPGAPPPDLPGAAAAAATAKEGIYELRPDKELAAMGETVGVSAWLKDKKGNEKPAKSDWTVSGAGKLEGTGTDVADIQVKGTNAGIAQVSAVHYGLSAGTNITFVKIELTTTKGHGLWWFNGENAANYDESGTLTAQGVTEGTFKWDVTVAGADKVDLNNGGADADSITATDDNTVTVKSTDASAVQNDVTVRLTYEEVVVCEKSLTVFAPSSTELQPAYPTYVWYWYGPGWITRYRFKVLDQFGDALPKEIEINEKYGAFEEDYEGENWSPLADSGDMTSGICFNDEYRFLGLLLTPTPVSRASPEGATKIFHAEQEYRAGSTTPGNGMLIKTHKLQVYRGEAKQE